MIKTLTFRAVSFAVLALANGQEMIMQMKMASGLIIIRQINLTAKDTALQMDSRSFKGLMVAVVHMLYSLIDHLLFK